MSGVNMGQILAIANQKGGVGKTTTAVTVAAALAELGQRVLLIDADAQACATFSLGIDPEDFDPGWNPLLDPGATPDRVRAAILTTPTGVDVLPAMGSLARADDALSDRTERHRVLRVLVRPLTENYDWIIIDCSPSLGLFTINALIAADLVLVPVQCETLAHRGVGQLMETIDEVRTWANPELRVVGILPVGFDSRTVHSRAVHDDLATRYGVPLLNAIPRSIRFAEAPATGHTILATAPQSLGANAYRQVAKVLLG